VRLVLDPGVLVSAAITPNGVCWHLVERGLDGDFELIVSPRLLEELEEVLLRPKFRNVLSQGEARGFVHFLAATAELITDPPPHVGLTRDEDDDYLVALARAVDADGLVSGDPDLTELTEQVPPVLTPRETLDRLDRARACRAAGKDVPDDEEPSIPSWIAMLDREPLPEEPAWVRTSTVLERNLGSVVAVGSVRSSGSATAGA
jgi:putative PIN family toxin of toxin-antitoxin system